MAVKMFEETDLIEVTNPPVLIFGQPGAGKTSLAQTAKNPLTLDFDAGSHRSAFRKAVLRFDSWEEVVDVQRNGLTSNGKKILGPNFEGKDSIVLDTVGSLLKSMSFSIMASNAKLGNRAGGLSMQGWGILKTTFDSWLAALRQLGKQVIMIAHEKEEKDGDNRILRPDIQGGSYAIVMNAADIVGYLSYRNNVRFISWDPTDAYFAKNGAQLQSGPIPDFSTSPHFMAELLDQAKANLGHTAKASAAIAQIVQEWQERLEPDPTVEELNGFLPEIKSITQEQARIQVWAMVQGHAEQNGFTFDKQAKAFKAKEVAA